MKRYFTLCLALLLGTMCSCGQESSVSNETADTAEITAAKEETSPYLDKLPDDLDFGGTTLKLHVGAFTEFLKDPFGEFCRENENGELINDAIYARNRTIEERFHCTLQYDGITYDYNTRSDEMNYVNTSLMAGDNAFDILFEIVHLLPSYITSGALCDLRGMEYIDFDAPWWMQKYNEKAEINDKLFFAVGDITTSVYNSPFAFYYNKELANALDMGNLYDIVRDGKWTLDALSELCISAYQDVNGNGKQDSDDRYGLVIQSGNEIMGFIQPCGVTLIDHPKNSTEAEYVFGCEHNVAVVERLYQLLYETTGSYYPNKQVVANEHLFYQGKTVFTGTYFNSAAYYRELDFDYGILPYPKYDETQPEYLTHLCTDCMAVCIPVTCMNQEWTSAVVEALASIGYQSVRPAYFDISMKEKYTRDADTKEMIDLIVSGIDVDFGEIYTYQLNSLSDEFKSLLSSKSKNLTSKAASIEKKINTALEALLSAINEIE